MNAFSTPPRTPKSLASQNSFGKAIPAMPRKTLDATVNLPNLMTALLMPLCVGAWESKIQHGDGSGERESWDGEVGDGSEASRTAVW